MNADIGRVLRVLLTLGLATAGISAVGAASAPQSLFAASKAGNDSGPEGTYYELGTIFRADVAGNVTHLRVYALATASGAHTARLWRNADNALVAGPFTWTYGGAAGCVTFDIPDVPTLANTADTVSVSTCGVGRHDPFLHGKPAVADGNGVNLGYPAGDGVFNTAAGARPTQTFQNANYFRDIVFVAVGPPPPTNGPVQITEFLAENDSGLLDEDGDASDWLELYNPSAAAIALGGYRLFAGTESWTFPNVSLAGQEFLVVFASGKN